MAGEYTGTGIAVNLADASIVGVDLGGTKTSAAMIHAGADSEPGPRARTGPVRTIATPSDAGPAAVLDAAAEVMDEVLQPADGYDVIVGIGTAGLVDSSTGRIASSTEAIREWAGTDVATGIRQRLSARGNGETFVHVENDVNAHAVGEATYGSATNCGSLLLVTVGTGVGAAFVDGGTPRRGAHFGAGEIGHVPTPGAQDRRCTCGRYGHLEGIAAGPALTRNYDGQGSSMDVRTIIGRAVAGEPEASRVVTEAATALGRALAGQVTMLDPDVVLLGGGVADAGTIWWDTVESTLREELIDVLCAVPVRRPELGAAAAMLGAAHTAAMERQASGPAARITSQSASQTGCHG